MANKALVTAGVAGLLMGFTTLGVSSSNRSHRKPKPPTTTMTTSIGTTTTVPASSGVPTDNLNSAVTQANIKSTICVSGYTKTIRPPQSYTGPLKVKQIASYGYTDTNTSSYEEDHVVALEIGGAPSNPANLWPEPHTVSPSDDQEENILHQRVCEGRITLAQGQQMLYDLKVQHGYDRTKSTT